MDVYVSCHPQSRTIVLTSLIQANPPGSAGGYARYALGPGDHGLGQTFDEWMALGSGLYQLRKGQPPMRLDPETLSDPR